MVHYQSCNCINMHVALHEEYRKVASDHNSPDALPQNFCWRIHHTIDILSFESLSCSVYKKWVWEYWGKQHWPLHHWIDTHCYFFYHLVFDIEVRVFSKIQTFLSYNNVCIYASAFLTTTVYTKHLIASSMLWCLEKVKQRYLSYYVFKSS